MRLVAVSDLHLDRSTLGVSRFTEIEGALNQAVTYAIDTKADAFVFPGDLCEPDTPDLTFLSINRAIAAALELRDACIPSFWVAGNHDVSESGGGTTTLTPLAALERYEPLVNVAERPCWFELTSKLALVCLPFTPVSHAYDPAHEAARMMREVRHVGMKAIVVSHLSIPGIVPEEETEDLPRGRETLYPFKETQHDVLVRLSGHYHRRQVFDPQDYGPPIHVVGAPARYVHGHDEASEPAFLVISVPG